MKLSRIFKKKSYCEMYRYITVLSNDYDFTGVW